MARPKKERPQDAGTPQDVQDILADLGDEAKYVTLWKVESGRENYIDTFPPSDWSLEKVRSYNAGGGEYRVRIAKKGERDSNRSQWAKTRTFYMWGGAAVTPQGGSSSLVEKLALAILPTLAVKLLADKQADPLLLELVKQSGRGGNGPDAVAVQQLVETARALEFEKGRVLGRAEATAESGGANTDSPLVAAIHEVGPALVEAMRGNRTTARTVQATARVADDSAGTASVVPEWVTRVRPFLSHMLGWADSGKTPEVKAVNLLDDLSEDHLASLAQSCASPTFVRDVFTWLPELGGTDARREWFTKFLVELQSRFGPDDDNSTEDGTDATAGSADGRAGHSADDADTGSGITGAATAGGGSAGAPAESLAPARHARARSNRRATGKAGQ